ncbi:P-loop containing nucleoside triphosphate hydrolase protein [Guyanagaster necrorhizus]|uniref:P-loop containing nucleoside triphosphate hydrolase protein n=1 Tax=Guyanagaster necrorhizus TaxID=856835 RepID=A0A9P7VHM2_9AGAR|nr:P-loop containing nucleoside triphosphate hydrolase protein [Guyanagaster necrorhizus MCA 3950]KAG7440535.1 P-loop containing nucleoside triphosphate hydrolase protein [Guyanagaster necrorhizus MCA 3950]
MYSHTWRKTIRNSEGISTFFEAGKVNVILGPSGSGKSSLLNLMAQHRKSSLRMVYTVEGELKLNDRPVNTDIIDTLCSYVTQDDTALLPYLTVRDTLEFATALRLPNWMSKEQKLQKAGEVMKKVGLTGCADTLVGNELLKGISGGEKCRVSIAIQALTEPRILILPLDWTHLL